MTIKVDFPPATLERLQAEAQASGQDVETFVREAVERKLVLRKKTFAEILKPIHDAVEASGMTEQDVDAFLEGEMRAARAERRTSRQSP